MSTYIDPKLAAGAGIGPAASIVLWIVLYIFVAPIRHFAQDDPVSFALLVTATGTVFGGALGYKLRNEGSPVPGDGAGVAPEDLADPDA